MPFWISLGNRSIKTIGPLPGSAPIEISNPPQDELIVADIAVSPQGAVVAIGEGRFQDYLMFDVVGTSTRTEIGTSERRTYDALEFTTNGRLFSYKTSSHEIIEINTVTGGTTPFASIQGLVKDSSFQISDLAFDPVKSQLYAIGYSFQPFGTSNSNTLFSIDLNSRAVRQIGNINVQDITGLLFNAGVLFGYTKDNGAELVINPSTAQAYVTGRFVGTSVSGAALEFDIGDRSSIIKAPSLKDVNFNLLKTGGLNRKSLGRKWESRQTWIIVHGFRSNPQEFTDVADAISQVRPNDIVLTLDWRRAATEGGITSNDPRVAAEWIGAVADFAEQKLRAWGLTSGGNVNLVGHSLGSLLSAEIASRFGKVNTLTALEPPSDLNPASFDSFLSYDLDGRTSARDALKPFNQVSNFSRAFVGTKSLSANTFFAQTAHESILVDFGGTRVSLIDEHTRVDEVFVNLIRSGTQRLANNLLRLNDYRTHSEFRNNAFSRDAPFNQRLAYEGVLRVGNSNSPISFTAKNAQTSGADDDRILGTNGNDTLQAGAGSDILTGGLGADRFVLATGSALTAGVDTISDFIRSTDRIVLSKAALRLASAVGSGFSVAAEFASVTSDAAAATSSAVVTYNRSNGRLFYNQNGAAAGYGTGAQLAAFTGNPALAVSDFIIQ